MLYSESYIWWLPNKTGIIFEPWGLDETDHRLSNAGCSIRRKGLRMWLDRSVLDRIDDRVSYGEDNIALLRSDISDPTHRRIEDLFSF